MVYPQYVQAGILKAHGRPHTCYILCQFKAEGTAIRSFVKALRAHISVTSHSEQLEDTAAHNQSLLSGGEQYREKTIMNLGFSYSGMMMMDIPDLEIPTDRAFRRGLASLGQELPWYPSDQQGGYDVLDFGPFEAIVVLSHSNRNTLQQEVDQVLNLIDDSQILAQKNGVVVTPVVEYGVSISEVIAKGSIGPLGYRDGLSERRTIEEVTNLALVREEGYLLEEERKRETYAFGSFMFYQKINLNHSAFANRIKGIAHHPNFKGGKDPIALAEALLMGRFKNGTPIMFTHDGSVENASLYKDAPFDYHADPIGELCPFNAHARLANPRNNGPAGAQIIRRGTFYGDGLGDVEGAQVKGLHFVSLQKSLKEQLLPILRRMQQLSSFDPITYGKNSRWSFEVPKVFLKDQGTRIVIESDDKISEYIGGGFFYLPSLSMLERLSIG